MTGLQAGRRLRDTLGAKLPIIILSGDIATDTLADVSLHGCLLLHKPVKLADLAQATNGC